MGWILHARRSRSALRLAAKLRPWQVQPVDGLSCRWLDPGVADDREAWTALLERCDHDFHQLPAYVELEARRLDGSPTAIAIDTSRGAALLPLILRRIASDEAEAQIDATSPYGYPAPLFLASDPSFAAAAVDAMVSAMRERGVITAFIRLHPLLDAPLTACERHGAVIDHGPTVWIDLTADETTQWGEYRGTHRNLIRRAKREGLHVRFDDHFAELDAFSSVYAETMIRLDARWSEFGREYLDGLATALGEHGFLALVLANEEVIAGGLFTRCKGLVQYHFSGTASAWQRASPSRLLLDEVRRRCTALGDRRMHLGGGVGAQEDALFRFKRGFSRHTGRFRSWRVIPDAQAYATLVSRWEALGGDPARTDDFFPRYRAPILSASQELNRDS